MIKKLEHIGILVSDMDRSISFYKDVIGLTLRDRVKLGDTVELAFLYAPGQESVEVELIAKGEIGPNNGVVNHLAFTVEDIETEIKRLKEQGVKLLDETPRDLSSLNVRIAFFEGPDGEVLELMQKN